MVHMQRKKITTRGSPDRNVLLAEHCRLADFDGLDRERTLFILPVGSLEVHGYHLPNNTDMVSCVMMAREAARMFVQRHKDWRVVLMPLLNIGTDELPLPGSIEFSRKTVYRALKEYARSLQRFGFKNLAITCGHGGPGHNLAMDDACRTCNRKYGMKMISPSIRVFQEFIFGKKFHAMEAELGRKLKPAVKKGLVDIEHAGGWETSIMLAEAPALVSRDFRTYASSRIKLGRIVKKLAQILGKVISKLPIFKGLLRTLGLPLDEGLRILLTAGRMYDNKKKRFTYSGDPSVADAAIGRAFKAAISKEITDLLEQVYITGAARPSDIVSNYSTIIFMRKDFRLVLVWIVLVVAIMMVVMVCYKAGILFR
jgi:creatinine amidohydrolase/Fe(II)-dependent formamide hydrolase-like protein